MLSQSRLHSAVRISPWTPPANAPRTDVAPAPATGSLSHLSRVSERQQVVNSTWNRVFAAAQAATNQRSVEMSERPF
ncbi:MAG: hypothetical protein EB084_07715 [Proteobacteria bacterium]|nr:hypothetical protein [Pseudomonadota bacterium]